LLQLNCVKRRPTNKQKSMRSFMKFLLAAVLIAGAGHTIAKPLSAVSASAYDIVDRHLSGFHAVDVAGSFDVRITQGSTESVKVQAPADMMDRVKTEVSGGVLKIYNKHDTFHWGDLWGHHKKIVVYVTAKNLDAVSVTGSGDVDFREGISANNLKLSVSGSGDMTGKVRAKTLESSLTGSGDMRLSGNAESSTVSVVGSGDYAAHNLSTVNTEVRVSGSGDASINASNRVDAAVNGSGDVHYTGRPKSVNKRKNGSGDISGS
jgi:hypothetical protein